MLGPSSGVLSPCTSVDLLHWDLRLRSKFNHASEHLQDQSLDASLQKTQQQLHPKPQLQLSVLMAGGQRGRGVQPPAQSHGHKASSFKKEQKAAFGYKLSSGGCSENLFKNNVFCIPAALM